MSANTQEILMKVHNASDIKEKRKYIRRLSQVLDKESADELKKRLESSKDIIEIERCRFLLWRKEVDRSIENLSSIVRNCEDEEKVVEAILFLGDEEYHEATGMLVSLLSSSNSFFRNAAAISLSKIPSQQVLQPVVKAIKDNPDDCESLVYPLQEIDCTEAVELLVDLFIKKPNAPWFRINVIHCFKRGAVKRLTLESKNMCCEKIMKGIEHTNIAIDIEQLETLYDCVSTTQVAD